MLEVLHEKILVQPMEAQATTTGGIDIPLDLQKKPCKGKVIEIGCGLKDRPMVIKKGATVFYIYGAGTKIEHDGMEYLAMRDTDCLIQIIDET